MPWSTTIQVTALGPAELGLPAFCTAAQICNSLLADEHCHVASAALGSHHPLLGPAVPFSAPGSKPCAHRDPSQGLKSPAVKQSPQAG